MGRRTDSRPTITLPDPPPIPSGLRASAWWPAMAVLPGEHRRTRRGLKIFATDTGLYVYDREPADTRQVDRIDAAWWSPIDYDKTPPPATDHTARYTGIPIHTEAGLVTITPQSDCGCGKRALKGWYPEWAGTIHAWSA